MANVKEAGEKKPIYKKWWFWVIIIIIVIALANSGKDSDSTTTDTSGNDTSTQTKNSTSEAKKDYKAGEVVKLNNHEVTVTTVSKDYKAPYSQPNSSANTYVVIEVSINNTGNKDLSVNEYGFKLEDETGTQRSSTYVGDLDGPMEYATLSPGGKTTGKMVFEAKKDSSIYKLHYAPGIYGGDEVIIDL